MNVFDTLDVIEKIELKAEKFDYDSLLIKGYIPILSVIFEKKCLEKNILFDEFLESNEDWDFWLKLAQQFEFYPIDKITSEFFFDKNKNLESYYNTRKIIYKKYISEKRFFEVEKEREDILFLDNEPIKGDLSSNVMLWDAGTEQNQEIGLGADQAPRQSSKTQEKQRTELLEK